MYYENFQKLCEERGVKPGTVSKATKVSTATLTAWKQNKYTPKQDKLQKIADYFQVPLSVITGSNESASLTISTDAREVKLFTGTTGLRVSFQIPVLGRVAAGIPIEAVEDIIDYEEITEAMARDGEYFALQIKGDSMEPRMKDGDVVIVRKQNNADDGDIVIATVNGDDATCKVLKRYENGDVALLSLNPSYQPFYFSKQEVKDTPIQIWGKVKELRAKF
jgi:repressor LexA